MKLILVEKNQVYSVRSFDHRDNRFTVLLLVELSSDICGVLQSARSRLSKVRIFRPPLLATFGSTKTRNVRFQLPRVSVDDLNPTAAIARLNDIALASIHLRALVQRAVNAAIA